MVSILTQCIQVGTVRKYPEYEEILPGDLIQKPAGAHARCCDLRDGYFELSSMAELDLPPYKLKGCFLVLAVSSAPNRADVGESFTSYSTSHLYLHTDRGIGWYEYNDGNQTLSTVRNFHVVFRP